MLQNRPTSRFFEEAGAPPGRSGTPSDCRSRHQPAGVGAVEEVGRSVDLAVVGAQPRQRLVVAHLALRQRDDRLEIEVDPVGLDGARELRRDLRRSKSPKLPPSGCLRPPLRPPPRCRWCRRSPRADRSGRPARAFAAPACAAAPRQDRLVRRDRVGKVLHQRAELAISAPSGSVAARALSSVAPAAPSMAPIRRPSSRPGGRGRRFRARDRRSGR